MRQRSIFLPCRRYGNQSAAKAETWFHRGTGHHHQPVHDRRRGIRWWQASCLPEPRPSERSSYTD